MHFTLSTTLSLLLCAASSVSASFDAGHVVRSGHAARDYTFGDLSAAYAAGEPDPRVSKRTGVLISQSSDPEKWLTRVLRVFAVQKRFDPATQ